MTGKSILLPMTEAIMIRRSWRTYSAKPVEPGIKEKIRSFISALDRPPFGSAARFRVIDLGPEGGARVAGTYGVIKGAETFLSGAVRQGPMDLEDFGFLFEKIILFATAIGLDTCWMGVTFSASVFSGKMALEQDEKVPIVSPLGYRAGRRSIKDALFHLSAGSKNRKPWSALFFDAASGLPLVQQKLGKLALPFEMVRLAPSAVNKQPWRLFLDGSSVHFYLKRTRGYESMFRTDLQRIDMGIAMCHFEIAAKEAGIEGGWKIENPGIPRLTGEMEYVGSWV